MQIGRGTYTPTLVNDEQFQSEVFRYKDTLKQDMEEASLVISHGGQYPQSICVYIFTIKFTVCRKILMSKNQ